jgi:hypothetical protein
MSLVEGLVFNNLSECRERANRERFILPENEKIVQTMKNPTLESINTFIFWSRAFELLF